MTFIHKPSVNRQRSIPMLSLPSSILPAIDSAAAAGGFFGFYPAGNANPMGSIHALRCE